ncbi:MAG: cation-transporting P-type ATPase [Gammaproteobacteria bacterium]|jgi:magnesium-transporting ATPase (P-type)|nr:cation-transporting P-type ATPase [Gammaproteobacteria bacterium]
MSDKNNWHDKTKEQVLSELETRADGLGEDEVRLKQEIYGPNRLPQAEKSSFLKRFLHQFDNILIYVLIGAAVITALLEHWVDTSVILAVVIINAIIGFIQEGKAEMAMDAIRNMLAPKASVLRDGHRQTVEGEALVPGDIVLLEAGDKVPADLRLFKLRGLQIQEAILTGESIAVQKQTEPVDVNAPLGDRSCLAFSGTTVTSGQGKGIVVVIGEDTEVGRISGMLSEVQTLTTPLVEQMDAFAKKLTLFIIAVAVLILSIGYFLLHHDFTELFMAVVGLIVAAIPEGLPAVLTITLAVGVQAMARRNAIIRRMPAIETLGSVSVICADKTGTLTRNEMSVATVAVDERIFNVHGEGYEPAGEIKQKGESIVVGDYPTLIEMARAALLCNDAELKNNQAGWSVEGDPMEGALLAFAGRAGINYKEQLKQWTRTDEIPFDALHKYMATLNHDHEDHAFIFVKGAPETILSMCHQQRSGKNDSSPLNKDEWHERADKIAAQGQRVLALAMKPIKPEHTVLEHSDIEDSLLLLGMVGLIDPPRKETIDAVEECHNAGISVKMITGDHAATAGAIGQQIGLKHADKVLTGTDINKLDVAELREAVMETDVFARASPEHKLRLVTALQSHELVVAMTGDGVNDAPALKRADAGIAMGQKGSEAAKEASELVLADDNFASIAAAVREGRTVYDNIKKVISWTLPTNGGEASTIMLALMLGMALPITPIQILWVNMITAVSLGIALAFEPTQEDAMKRPPRPRNQPLLTGELVWHIILVTALFLVGVFGIHAYALAQGYSLELSRTIAMNTLVIMEIFHLLFIRNISQISLTWRMIRGTRAVWLAISFVVIGQLAITYWPFFQTVFSTEAVSFIDSLLIIVVGVLLFVIIEIEKQIRLRLFD